MHHFSTLLFSKDGQWLSPASTELYIHSCAVIAYLHTYIHTYRFMGNPGAYMRIGPFRLEECPTYGCLLELTIQLGIIFGGKQILNDVTELGIP